MACPEILLSSSTVFKYTPSAILAPLFSLLFCFNYTMSFSSLTSWLDNDSQTRFVLLSCLEGPALLYMIVLIAKHIFIMRLFKLLFAITSLVFLDIFASLVDSLHAPNEFRFAWRFSSHFISVSTFTTILTLVPFKAEPCFLLSKGLDVFTYVFGYSNVLWCNFRCSLFLSFYCPYCCSHPERKSSLWYNCLLPCIFFVDLCAMIIVHTIVLVTRTAVSSIVFIQSVCTWKELFKRFTKTFTQI